MGQALTNVELVLDRPEGSMEALAQLRLHRETPPLDERSVYYSEADHLRLRDAAAEGEKAFFGVASEVLGPWWAERRAHGHAWWQLYRLR